MAWHLLRRERARLLVAMIGIAFADLLMLMQLGFKGALFASTSMVQKAMKADLFLVNPHFETLISPQSISRDLLYRCKASPNVDRVQPVKMGLTPWRNPLNGRSRSILVLGFDPTFPVIDSLSSTDAASLKGLGNVVFDRLSRPEFGPIEKLFLERKAPVATEIDRHRVQVIGFYSMGASFAADGGVLASEETFRSIFTGSKRDQIEFGLISLRDPSRLEETRMQLQALIGQDADVITHRQLEMREENYWANSTGIGFIFGMGVVMGFVVGVVIVYQILHGDVESHLSQYATLKAMGYSNLFLLAVLFQESLLLAVLGFLPGLGLSTFLYAQASAATQLPLIMSPERAAGVFLATLAMCAISAAIASRSLILADPAEIF